MNDPKKISPEDIGEGIKIENNIPNQGAQGVFNAPVTFNQVARKISRSDEALLCDYLYRLHRASNALAFGDPFGGGPSKPMGLAGIFTMLHVRSAEDLSRRQSSSRMQQEILRYVNQYRRERGSEPTVQEIEEFIDDLSIDTIPEKILRSEMKRQAILASLHSSTPRRQAVLDVLSQEKTVILLGDPGAGKSTVVSFLSLALAEAQSIFANTDKSSGLVRLGKMWRLKKRGRATAPFPIRVSLKMVVHSLWDGVHEVQHSDLNVEERATLIGLLKQKLDDGTALFLFDGLDEVPMDRLEGVQELVAESLTRFTRSRAIVTCRSFDYRNEPVRQIVGLPVFELLRFSRDAQSHFVTLWYQELVRTGRRSEPEALAKHNNLQAALRSRDELADLAGTPLLLSLMALVHTEEGELPLARALLYHRCVRLLLWRWRPVENTKVDLDEGRILTLGAELGYFAHLEEQKQGKAFRGLQRKRILDIAMQFYERGAQGQGEETRRKTELLGMTAAHRFLNSNGMLLSVGDDCYSFAHRTFQEFLAGQYLGSGSRLKKAVEHSADPHWRVALHLMCGYAAREGNLDYALRLIRALLDRSQDEQILAAEMLTEIGKELLLDKGYDDVLDTDGLWSIVAQRICKVAFNVVICPDLHTRARTAHLFNQLGDERAALILDRSEYWSRRTEPGQFMMGDENGLWDERPAFSCTIHFAYALARYPVTNQQYLHFLEDLQIQGRSNEVKLYRPKYWKGLSYPRNKGSHPVVGVTWFSSSAFAKWANEFLRRTGVLKDNEFVRLPTEAEWERAAAYPEKIADFNMGNLRRECPWGTFPTSHPYVTMSEIHRSLYRESFSNSQGFLANTTETGLDGTSIVGLFPHGAADCGAEELIGNVWEWCSTIKQAYPLLDTPQSSITTQKRSPSTEKYVLRGGSWKDDISIARCSYRFYAEPEIILDNIGFRLIKVVD